MRLYIHKHGTDDRLGADERPELFALCLRDYLEAEGILAGDPPGAAPEPPRTAKGEHGKPRFAEPPLAGRVHFSVSHSGRFWAALFAEEEVGMDIEDMAARGNLTMERMADIADRFFADDERAQVTGRDAFFAIWTAKEAYAKYTGEGLTGGSGKFSVTELMTPQRDGTARGRDSGAARDTAAGAARGPAAGVGAPSPRITTLAPAPDLACAICSAGPEEHPPAERVIWLQRGAREGAEAKG